MAQVAFHYPTQASPTLSWTPSRNCDPVIEEPSEPGVLAKIMADRSTMVSYQVASTVTTYRYPFHWLTTTDRTNLTTFIGTVLGQTFEVVEPRAGAVVSVRFAPEFLERVPWVYSDKPAGWSVDVLLRGA